jgi:preprotein translocase subunit YajC
MGLVTHFALILGQSSAAKKSSFPFGLVFLPLMFVALYFLMIRPQRQRAAAQQRTMRQVAVGDEILTTSGMYGIVTAMDDDDLWLEVADGVELRVARGALMKVTQHAGGDGDGDEVSDVGPRGAVDSVGPAVSGAIDDVSPTGSGDDA